MYYYCPRPVIDRRPYYCADKPFTVVSRKIIRRTSDATVAGAEETERPYSIVERHDDNVAEQSQSFAVVHPQGIRSAVETAAVDPHLTAGRIGL